MGFCQNSCLFVRGPCNEDVSSLEISGAFFCLVQLGYEDVTSTH